MTQGRGRGFYWMYSLIGDGRTLTDEAKHVFDYEDEEHATTTLCGLRVLRGAIVVGSGMPVGVARTRKWPNCPAAELSPSVPGGRSMAEWRYMPHVGESTPQQLCASGVNGEYAARIPAVLWFGRPVSVPVTPNDPPLSPPGFAVVFPSRIERVSTALNNVSCSD